MHKEEERKRIPGRAAEKRGRRGGEEEEKRSRRGAEEEQEKRIDRARQARAPSARGEQKRALRAHSTRHTHTHNRKPSDKEKCQMRAHHFFARHDSGSQFP